jgi:hypothetical protein
LEVPKSTAKAHPDIGAPTAIALHSDRYHLVPYGHISADAHERRDHAQRRTIAEVVPRRGDSTCRHSRRKKGTRRATNGVGQRRWRPTDWLNVVVQFFSALTRRALRNGDFDSQHDLTDTITTRHNHTARPTQWRYDADADHARYLQRHPLNQHTPDGSMTTPGQDGTNAMLYWTPGGRGPRLPVGRAHHRLLWR